MKKNGKSDRGSHERSAGQVHANEGQAVRHQAHCRAGGGRAASTGQQLTVRLKTTRLSMWNNSGALDLRVDGSPLNPVRCSVINRNRLSHAIRSSSDRAFATGSTAASRSKTHSGLILRSERQKWQSTKRRQPAAEPAGGQQAAPQPAAGEAGRPGPSMSTIPSARPAMRISAASPVRRKS